MATNIRYPAIPQPRPGDTDSLFASVDALKRTVEMLLGMQAPPGAKALTTLDLPDAVTALGGLPAGPAGVQGLMGPPGFGIDGEDAPTIIIPGPPGIIGPPGLIVPGRDGEDGSDAFTIPGPPGVAGLAGLFMPGRDGEDGEQVLMVLSAGGKLVLKFQLFTAAGTYTPTPGMIYGIAQGVGNGGGGGSAQGSATSVFAGGGGASGGYSIKIFSAVDIGASQSVTFGSTGTGGAAGSNDGVSGGDVSLGALLVAKGGGGGLFGSSAQLGLGGAPPAVGTGDLAGAGCPGEPGIYESGSLTIAPPSGAGAPSIWGGGVRGVGGALGAQAGSNATGYGSGGSGARVYDAATNAAGGNGSTGALFIIELVLNP